MKAINCAVCLKWSRLKHVQNGYGWMASKMANEKQYINYVYTLPRMGFQSKLTDMQQYRSQLVWLTCSLTTMARLPTQSLISYS